MIALNVLLVSNDTIKYTDQFQQLMFSFMNAFNSICSSLAHIHRPNEACECTQLHNTLIAQQFL